MERDERKNQDCQRARNPHHRVTSSRGGSRARFDGVGHRKKGLCIDIGQLVAPVGELMVTAVYSVGGDVADKGVRHDIDHANGPLSGSNTRVAGSSGNGKFLLAPGDYKLE